MSVNLVRYEQAQKALSEAHRVDQVKAIRDKTQALAAYARQAKDNQMIAWATEIKVRAERRAGELLQQTQKAKPPGSNQHKHRSHDATDAPTLERLGINKSQSSRWQKLADIPEEQFERSIAVTKEIVGEVTSASLLKQAKSKHSPSRMAMRTRRS